MRLFPRLLGAVGACVVLACRALGADPAPAPSTVENSVVKVFSTVRTPDVFRPWTKQAPADFSGSGVVIEGKRILTNAHVVLYSNQVQVQANQAGDKIVATVEAIAPGIDLALLKLEDESFFDSHPPLRRASELPAVKDPVLVYGYPTGGSSLSITKGIVSRIEFTFYNYPVSGLRIQLDAAINPGNSGGPAVADDRMIGLAFSHLGGAENIGYIIPTEEIEIFLRQAQAGRRYSKPALYDVTQTLENAALRPFLKIDKADTGTLVLLPDSDDPAYPLRKWDLISKVGSIPVDDQGMIRQGSLRLDFHYAVQKESRDGRVPMEIVRDGKHVSVEVPVASDRPQVMPWLAGAYPRYFVYGPVVFSAATGEFVGGFLGNTEAVNSLLFDGNPMVTRRGDKPAFPGEEIVVISSPFLPHVLAEGYSNPIGHVVSEVNGVRIRNLKHLVQVLRDAKSDFVTLAFAGHGEETLVFPRRKTLEATEDILGDNGIREQGSPDLMEIWKAPPAP
jgi:S1-C subfamily serine protease